MVSDSLTMSRDMQRKPASKMASLFKKPQAFLTYSNEISEQKRVSFKIQNSSAGSRQSKQGGQKKQTLNTATNSEHVADSGPLHEGRHDSQGEVKGQEPRERHQSNLHIDLIDSQMRLETEESPPCQREPIRPLQKPNKNNYATGRIVMHVSSKSKGSGLRTHGVDNKGSNNENRRDAVESDCQDSVSGEWEANDDRNNQKSFDEGQTAKMTMFADMNSDSEAGPLESDLSKCSGNEIVSIENSQSFKFGPGQL